MNTLDVFVLVKRTVTLPHVASPCLIQIQTLIQTFVRVNFLVFSRNIVWGLTNMTWIELFE